jgi:hypothetical protein
MYKVHVRAPEQRSSLPSIVKSSSAVAVQFAPQRGQMTITSISATQVFISTCKVDNPSSRDSTSSDID